MRDVAWEPERDLSAVAASKGYAGKQTPIWWVVLGSQQASTALTCLCLSEVSVFSLLLSTLALAQPVPVLALGDGLVPLENTERAQASSSWVAVLADCLEERAPGAYTVADRTEHGETATSALARVPEFRKLVPGVAVVGVGAPEAVAATPAPVDFRLEVDSLVRALLEEQRPRMVLLVGMVPGGVDPSDDPHRARALALEQELVAVSAEHEGVEHVGLWSTWPSTPEAHKLLALPSGGLSASGHARVAARLCDEVLKPPTTPGDGQPLPAP